MTDYASKGGGIYNDSTGSLYLGYNTANEEANFTGGIYYNYATSEGGAIYMNSGSVTMASGNIKYNATNGEASSIYNSGTLTINGETQSSSINEYISLQI